MGDQAGSAEANSLDCALADLLQLDRMVEAIQGREHAVRMFEGRLSSLESRCQAGQTENKKLLSQLSLSTAKYKSLSKECNAALSSIAELQSNLNKSQDKCAAIRRELEEKSMEFEREEKKKKAEVENAITAGKEEMERALAALTEKHEQRIRNLQNQIEEKTILSGCGASSSTLRAPVCTVSEAQLRQSLTEAKEEIKAFKEQVRLKDSEIALLKTKLPAPTAKTKYIISSESEDDDVFAVDGRRHTLPQPAPKKSRTMEKKAEAATVKTDGAGKKLSRAREGKAPKGTSQRAPNQTLKQQRAEGAGKGKSRGALEFEAPAHDPFLYL